jgi:hypothetical protein
MVRQRLTRPAWLVPVVLLALVMTACGDDDEGSSAEDRDGTEYAQDGRDNGEPGDDADGGDEDTDDALAVTIQPMSSSRSPAAT